MVGPPPRGATPARSVYSLVPAPFARPHISDGQFHGERVMAGRRARENYECCRVLSQQ